MQAIAKARQARAAQPRRRARVIDAAFVEIAPRRAWWRRMPAAVPYLAAAYAAAVALVAAASGLAALADPLTHAVILAVMAPLGVRLLLSE